MTTVAWPVRAIRKDVAALLPTWFASVIVIVAGRWVNATSALVAYVLAAATIGALAVGHEYTHRTLASLLAQPVDRWRLLAAKLTASGSLLVALGIVAALCGVGHADMLWWSSHGTTVPVPMTRAIALVLPAVAGLCLAPCLTMLGGGTLPGAVFTAATLVLAWFAGDLVGMLRHGTLVSTSELAAFRTAFAMRAMTLLCGLGAVGTAVGFSRLQASDGAGLSLTLPRVRTDIAVPARIRRLPWMAVCTWKELRLHSMAYTVTGLYALAWLTVLLTRPIVPIAFQLPLQTITAAFAGIVPILVGAPASAEEHRLGTAVWQELLPVPAWWQWMVKVAVAIGLAVVLAIAVPRLLGALATLAPRGWVEFSPSQNIPWNLAWVAAGLCVASLYVSSLCSSSIRALVTAPAVFAAGTAAALAVERVSARVLFAAVRNAAWFRGADHVAIIAMASKLGIVMAAAGSVFLLWQGMLNHRSAARGRARVWQQARVQAIAIAVGAMIGGVVSVAGQSYWSFDGPGGVRLSGRVEFDGTSPRPAPDELKYLRVVLDPPNARSQVGQVSGTLNPNGRFETPPTWPGAYVVRTSPLKGWTLESVTADGRDLSETEVDLRANLDDVVVTFTDRTSRFRGEVTGATSGKQAAVIIIPADSALWSNYALMIRRSRLAVTGANGSFDAALPVGGTYLAVALPTQAWRDLMRFRAWGYSYPDRATLAKLAPLADRFDIHGEEVVTRALPLTSLPR